MSAGKNAIHLIKDSEGLRLKRYVDSAGFDTIGWGHKVSPDEHFTEITEAQAEQLLMQDVMHCDDCIAHCVKVTLNQNQHDALVDFIFNLGCSRFANSTLLRLLNNGDYQGAAEQFDRWIYGNGTVLNGLVTRRAKEKQLFLAPIEAA